MITIHNARNVTIWQGDNQSVTIKYARKLVINESDATPRTKEYTSPQKSSKKYTSQPSKCPPRAKKYSPRVVSRSISPIRTPSPSLSPLRSCSPDTTEESCSEEVCTLCSKKFKSPYFLAQHMENKHTDVSENKEKLCEARIYNLHPRTTKLDVQSLCNVYMRNTKKTILNFSIKFIKGSVTNKAFISGNKEFIDGFVRDHDGLTLDGNIMQVVT